jgi:hypothetical protein
MEHLSVPDETGSESKAERRLRKETERAAESTPLDPWERYRALNDLVDHMLDVIEMADRRTRFALAQAARTPDGACQRRCRRAGRGRRRRNMRRCERSTAAS